MSLLQSNQSFEMQSALEHYNEHRTTLKMTTGSADLDSLIDGIQEGMFYLFYGNNSVVLDAMVHRFLVNCVLPVKENHGFESMGIFFNNVNYYDFSRRTSASVSPEKIGIAAKCSGIDPKIVFKNPYILTAYNGSHQLSVLLSFPDDSLIANQKSKIKNPKSKIQNSFTSAGRRRSERRRLKIPRTRGASRARGRGPRGARRGPCLRAA